MRKLRDASLSLVLFSLLLAGSAGNLFSQAATPSAAPAPAEPARGALLRGLILLPPGLDPALVSLALVPLQAPEAAPALAPEPEEEEGEEATEESEEMGVEAGVEGGIPGGVFDGGVEGGVAGGVEGSFGARTAVEALDEAERVHAPFDDEEMAAKLKAILDPQEGEEEVEEPEASSPAPLTLRQEVSPTGWFQLLGIPPGRYRLEINVAGHRTVWLVPIELAGSAEFVLRQPIALIPTFSVAVTLDPPRTPSGLPWVVEVSNIDDPTQSGGRNPRVHTLAEGRYELRDQIPGRFWVTAHDGHGGYFNELRNLPSIDTDHRSLVANVAPLRIEGRALVGGRAVGRELYLSQEQRGMGRAHLELGPDGRFSGRLPEAGVWHATVRSGSRELLEQDVTVSAGADGVATLEIDAPATRLFGKVVDPAGKPLPLGRVRLWGEGYQRELRADGQGNFEVLGLPPGRIGLRGGGVPGGCTAEGDPRVGEERIAELKAGRSLGPLTLRLRPTKRTLGHLVQAASSGEAPEVRMKTFHVVMVDGTPSFGFLQPDGTFAFDLPRASRAATLVVETPDRSLQIFPVSLGGSELRLAPGEGKGSVQVELPGAGKALYASGKILETTFAGRPLPAVLLGGHDLEYVDGRTLDLRDLPAGRYGVCLGPAGFFDRIDRAGPRGKSTVCAEGELKAGETLRLTLSAGR